MNKNIMNKFIYSLLLLYFIKNTFPMQEGHKNIIYGQKNFIKKYSKSTDFKETLLKASLTGIDNDPKKLEDFLESENKLNTLVKGNQNKTLYEALYSMEDDANKSNLLNLITRTSFLYKNGNFQFAFSDDKFVKFYEEIWDKKMEYPYLLTCLHARNLSEESDYINKAFKYGVKFFVIGFSLGSFKLFYNMVSPYIVPHFQELIREKEFTKMIFKKINSENINPFITESFLKSTRLFRENIIEQKNSGNLEKGVGIILHGPPGTGKTYLANCLGKLTESKTININAHEIFQYKGKKDPVKLLYNHLMKDIEKNNKPLILIMNELDLAIENDSVLSRILKQFEEENKGVFLIITTNNLSKLNPALLRDGRGGKKIEISYLQGTELAKLINHFSSENNIIFDENFDILKSTLIQKIKNQPIPTIKIIIDQIAKKYKNKKITEDLINEFFHDYEF